MRRTDLSLLPTEDIPGWPSLSDALRGLGSTPMVLTLVENEIPAFVAGQQALLAAAPPGLTTIDVRGAEHGFDTDPATGHGRAAVLRALGVVTEQLLGPPGTATPGCPRTTQGPLPVSRNRPLSCTFLLSG